jgi:hypothetical protein
MPAVLRDRWRDDTKYEIQFIDEGKGFLKVDNVCAWREDVYHFEMNVAESSQGELSMIENSVALIILNNNIESSSLFNMRKYGAQRFQ